MCNLKKTSFSVLLMCCIALLFVVISCDSNKAEILEEIPEDAVPVSLSITTDKTLSSDVNNDIMYWEFMATPKFELAGKDATKEKVYGQVSYWRTLPDLNTEKGVVKTTCDLGRYTSGNWLFELRALNSKQHVVAVGSTTTVVRSGLDNVVNITMLLDNADNITHGQSWDTSSRYTQVTKTGERGVETITRYGSVHIGFEVNKLDADVDNIDVVLYKQKFGTNNILGSVETITATWTKLTAGSYFSNWFVSADVDNYKDITAGSSNKKIEGMYFECEIPNQDAGSYIYTLQLRARGTDGNLFPIAGQSFDVVVLGGEETQVKGSLLANAHILQVLKLDETGTIYGAINGDDDGYARVNYEAPFVLSWVQSEEDKAKSKETAEVYYWFADGAEIVGQNGDEISYSCPVNEDGTVAYGLHRIMCIAVGNQGSLGSSSFDVIFDPKEGASLDNGDYQYPWPDNY